MEKCHSLVTKELDKLTNKKLGVTSLHQAKQKFIGQISLAEENRLSVIISLAKNILEEGKADSLLEIYKKINFVTASDILSVANDILMLNKLSSLTFLPE
jgi:predicted Zn-dependent peptidase